jgi:hypothetical protein
MFAEVVRSGAFLGLRVDPAQPMASRNAARSSRDVSRKVSKAASASAQARSTSSSVAEARARLEGERGRTVGQLRMFAEVVRSGAFLGLRVDPAQHPRPRRRAGSSRRRTP